MLNKSENFIRKFGCVNFIFKLFKIVYSPLKFRFYSKLKSYYYFKSFNVTIGANVYINNPFFKCRIGKNITIYSNSIFEFGENSFFSVGDNTLISYGVLVSCMDSIQIGNDVQIGEYTSIRDASHDHSDFGVSMKYNQDITKKIIIGNNVWIGRGCIILPGTIIEDGVVVGANSVVKGHLLQDAVYAGLPIKFVKHRIDRNEF